MERIVVNPLSVRGLGDVVSSKSLDDYVKCGMSLSQGSDSSLGTVFTGSYLAPAKLTLSVDRYISSSTESFTVSATLKNSSDTAISGESVYLDVNGAVMSATTDGSGVVSFTVDTDGSHEYVLKCFYRGTVANGGVFVGSSVVVVGTPTTLELNCTKDIIQSGENMGVWAKLTDDNDEGVPYATVNFYEEWTPGIRLSANPSVIQSGEDIDLSAQLIDVSDGSLVREAGHTISFYNEPQSNGLLFKDTTERTYTSETTSVSEKLTRIIGSLSDEDFTFEYDLKIVSSVSNVGGGLNIGATSEYSPTEITANYRLFFGTDNQKFSFNNRSDSSDNTLGGARTLDTWYHMKLVKTGDSFSAYSEGDLIATKTVDWFSSYDSFDIYFINWKGTCMIKNVEFKIDGE